MNLRPALFASLLILVPSLAHAQTVSLRGTFQDPTTRNAVAGVQVKLTNVADPGDLRRKTSRDDGSFEFIGLATGTYRLEATRLGYAPLRIEVPVTRLGQTAGVLALTPESIPIGGVTIRESPPPAIQKADTTEFQAGAVKTHKDATAEDLVQKLPGVTLENGQVRAQGENVQQVLVNGKPFLGSDPTAAMRNLPAEVVDRIQVYDRMSDQAEFSGFDDGQSQKTMNFILRDQKAQFGKVYAGYGDQDRYQAGGNATLVRGATRLSLLGMSNNTNQRNFSPQDLIGAMGGGGGGPGGPRMMMFGGGPGGGRGFGGMMRMGGGFGGGAFDPSSFLVGPQTGVSTTHSGGVNYVGQWSKRLSVSSSVFLNQTRNDNLQTLTREYLPPQDSLAFYDQSATTDARNGNQRFDARVEWTPDSLNSIILQPRLYFQKNDANSVGDARNSALSGDAVSAARGATSSTTLGNNLSGRLTLRHRFAKRGRNVSAEINAGHTLRDGDGDQRTLTDFYAADSAASDTLDQHSDSRTVTNSFATRIAFTEPLDRTFQLQAFYNPSLTRSASDARALGLDSQTAAHSVLDSALSNSYENRNTAHNGGLALRSSFGVWRLLTSAAYQNTDLHSEQTFPARHTVDRSFDDVLPSAILTASFANRRNLRASWSTSTNAPSISQLQNVVNNSNPLSLSSGNPDLRPTYSHNFSLRVSEADPQRSKSRFLFMNLVRTSHPIANVTFTAPRDTTIDGVALARGVQLTTPENLDVSWSANAFAVYSRPLGVLKSILSLNGGGSFNRTPTRINGATNRNSSYAIRSGAVLASNISANLDFTVSYQGTYNIARNTLSSNHRGDYYTHGLGLRLNTVIGPGIVMRQEVNHNLQSGVPSAYGQDVVLWSSTLGKKFLEGGKGEFRVTATDVLEQDRSVSRSITETYVQDSRDRTLGRYVQAVFTYSFK